MKFVLEILTGFPGAPVTVGVAAEEKRAGVNIVVDQIALKELVDRLGSNHSNVISPVSRVQLSVREASAKCNRVASQRPDGVGGRIEAVLEDAGKCAHGLSAGTDVKERLIGREDVQGGWPGDGHARKNSRAEIVDRAIGGGRSSEGLAGGRKLGHGEGLVDSAVSLFTNEPEGFGDAQIGFDDLRMAERDDLAACVQMLGKTRGRRITRKGQSSDHADNSIWRRTSAMSWDSSPGWLRPGR